MKRMFGIFVLIVIYHDEIGGSASVTPPQPPLPTTPEPEPHRNCGYESCHPIKTGDFINVHIVPHTHDDVGWLKTVDQYYYGSRNNIQQAGVQYILDSVMDALKKDKNRRFIYVETAFFWKWWIKQHDIVKSQVRSYVRNGQLEFIGGGWSMNDEAVTNYQSIIDQMTWGLRKLNDTFGDCGQPKIGWQIDPFGHSREMASIFAQLGYDGILLGRIDYQDKNYRLTTKSAEMVWRGSQNLGEKSDIFTGVMFNTYSPPKGFCFDILCSDEPIIDDRKSSDYNVDRRVDDLFDYLDHQSRYYATKNLIITMGGDFTYMDAETWFKNLDKLISYANQRQANGSIYNLIYSTPSCYVKAVHDASVGKKSWPVKRDDFFPYASDPHAFWTGYFTSRSTIKRFEREGNNFLQICKQLYTLAELDPIDRVDLNALREAMGVMQHHDAITGTEKEHVAHDYSRILAKGMDECNFITASALSKLVAPEEKLFVNDEPAPVIPFETCPLLNVSQCGFTEKNNGFVVTVYNPLSRPVSKHIRIPIRGDHYVVIDPKGNQLDTEIIPIPESILRIPGRKSNAKNELIFLASNLPPLGFKSYFVEEASENDLPQKPHKNKSRLREAEFQINETTGSISKIIMNNISLDFNQEFLYYKGFVGNNEVFANRSSGAYIFRPYGKASSIENQNQVKIYLGNLVSEVHQQYNDWISQIIRVYSGETYVEFDWIVGPIPTDDAHGKEIITRYTTPLDSNSLFYTDSNGRETLTRIRNFRPTWNLNLKEPVAGNYYPVTSKISIREKDLEVAVLTDRAQGGSSLEDGQIELMLHRKCLHDDAFGVGEALNETAFDKGLVTRGSHYVVFGTKKNPSGKTIAAQEKDIIQRKLLSSWTFLSPTNGLTYQQYKSKYRMKYAGLNHALPDNVQILTLEPWKGESFLLRLEHVIESNEDPVLSKPVLVDLKDLFAAFEITSLRETTLGANQWLSDNHRLHFNTSSYLEDSLPKNDKDASARIKWNSSLKNRMMDTKVDSLDDPIDLKIVLTAMQIRTFIIEMESK
nr:lysosomal alpha-mannosidase-like isoform X2 [Leptinotarsa decemlineata]